MIIEGGYILGPRRVYDDPLYKEMQDLIHRRKAVVGLYRFHAMQDLFRRAQFADSGLKIENKYIVIKRGQLFISVEKLAHEWGWSRTKVYKFFEYLENERATISTQKKHCGIIVTICKYDEYQSTKNYKMQKKSNGKAEIEHWKDTDRAHNNELNKGNEGNEGKDITPGPHGDGGDMGKMRYTKDGAPITNELADEMIDLYESLSKMPESKPKARGFVMGMLVQTTAGDLKSAIETYWFIVHSPRHDDFKGRTISGFANDLWKSFLPAVNPLKEHLKLEFKKDGKHRAKNGNEKPDWRIQ